MQSTMSANHFEPNSEGHHLLHNRHCLTKKLRTLGLEVLGLALALGFALGIGRTLGWAGTPCPKNAVSRGGPFCVESVSG